MKQCESLTVSMTEKDTDICQINDLCMNEVLVSGSKTIYFCACVIKGGSERIMYGF